MRMFVVVAHTACCKMRSTVSNSVQFNTRELLSNVERAARERKVHPLPPLGEGVGGRRRVYGTMENATTVLKVAFSVDVRSFIDIYPGRTMLE